MRSADARRLNASGLLSFLALLSILMTSQAVGDVTLPLNYEGVDDHGVDTLPQSPWVLMEPAALSPYPTAISVSGGILTLNKTWTGVPHIDYRVEHLDFTAATGVTVEMNLKLGASNSSPVEFRLTDEGQYFVYLLIYPDRIQRHRQNVTTADETDDADFHTTYRTLRVEFKSQHLNLYLDGGIIMNCPITGTTTGSNDRHVTFGIPGSTSTLGNGPAWAKFDYLRILQGTGGVRVPIQVKPDPNEVIRTTGVVFEWTWGNGDSWPVQVRKEWDGGLVYDDVGTGSTRLQLTDLDDGVYSWRVAAQRGADRSDWTDWVQFIVHTEERVVSGGIVYEEYDGDSRRLLKDQSKICLHSVTVWEDTASRITEREVEYAVDIETASWSDEQLPFIGGRKIIPTVLTTGQAAGSSVIGYWMYSSELVPGRSYLIGVSALGSDIKVQRFTMPKDGSDAKNVDVLLTWKNLTTLKNEVRFLASKYRYAIDTDNADTNLNYNEDEVREIQNALRIWERTGYVTFYAWDKAPEGVKDLQFVKKYMKETPNGPATVGTKITFPANPTNHPGNRYPTNP